MFDTASVRALRRLRPRITYANVMATLAMFIALGGGAYAVTVPRNSVGSAQLKKNAVNARAVRDGSLGRLRVSLRHAAVQRRRQGRRHRPADAQAGSDQDDGAEDELRGHASS